jgi:ribosomal protein S6--L-glutamate ligase
LAQSINLKSRAVRVAILSRNRDLYSTRRLAQAARACGHDALVVDTLNVPVKVGRGAGAPTFQRLPNVDAIIPRIGTSITFYGLAVVRQFEARGVVTTATSEAIAHSRDKLHSLQLMSDAELPIPRTAVVSDPRDIEPAIAMAGGLPVIVKLIRGTQGRGVFLATEMRTVESLWQSVQHMREQMLIQEFIKEAQGTDVRIIVIGRRCIAAMRRRAAAGEFRSNLHRGGSAVVAELDQRTRALAAQAAQVHGLGFAGVDVIPSNDGPLILEVNSSPGLEGIERTTGVDVATEVIRYLEREFRKRTRRPRRRSV